jgi:hypothetical protein
MIPVDELERLAAQRGFALHRVAGADNLFWLEKRGQMYFGGKPLHCQEWLNDSRESQARD